MCAVVALFGEPSQPAGATSFDCAATEIEERKFLFATWKSQNQLIEEVQFYCADASS